MKFLSLTKPLCLVIALILFSNVSAQKLQPEDAIHLYSFKTKNNKTVLLYQKKSDSSICYRFGTSKKVELEYCSLKADREQQIYYSYFLRGGGIANEGLDLNYVYFTNKEYKYIIYQTYSASDNSTQSGIRIIHLKTKEDVRMEALKGSIKGSLLQFRDHEFIAQGEDTFD